MPQPNYHETFENGSAVRKGYASLLAVTFLLWTVFGLLASFQMYSNTGDERAAFPLSRVLVLGLGNSWLKAAVTIPILLLLIRLHRAQRIWLQTVAAYAGLFALFMALHVSIRPFVLPFVVRSTGPGTMPMHFTYLDKVTIALRTFMLDNTWGFCTIVLVFHAWRYALQARIRAINEERLQARLARAELTVLKMQLQPHFLFNTLNTIYHLAASDSEKAQAMIARLASLLRLSLDHVSTDTVPLARELQFLDAYLKIEQTRFEERLVLSFAVAPETLDASVPNMLLQPLVENAIRHGISKKAGGGTIWLTSEKQDSRVILSIADNGALPATSNSRGIGLANTQARLEQTFGTDFRFVLEPCGVGTRVLLDLPYQPAREEREQVK